MTAAMALQTLTLGGVAAATGGTRLAGQAEDALGGVSIDSRTVRPGDLFVAVAGPRFDGHQFVAEAAKKGAAALLVHSPVEVPAGVGAVRVADTTRALGDLARARRQEAALPIVCITGSTGKTTTKDMTAALLGTRGPVLKTEGNLNNQYGLPLTLFRLAPEHRFAVLELGMSAPGEMRGLSDVARPDVAVITNVAAVHLESFDSVDDIARAKAEILEGLVPGGRAVLNGDDPRVRAVGEAFPGRVVWFGHDRAFDVSAERWRGTVHGMRFDMRLSEAVVDVALPLAGRHFVMNFLAAAAVAHALGVPPEAIGEAAPTLAPARRRGQVLRLREGITLIDDTYNSNPLAVEAALGALGLAGGRRRVVFLGDMLELGPQGPALHRATGERAAGAADVVVGVGTLARDLVEGAAAGAHTERHHFPDSTAAAGAAPSIVRPGDSVLVKGSRGIATEHIVDALVRAFGRAEDEA